MVQTQECIHVSEQLLVVQCGALPSQTEWLPSTCTYLDAYFMCSVMEKNVIKQFMEFNKSTLACKALTHTHTCVKSVSLLLQHPGLSLPTSPPRNAARGLSEVSIGA